MATSLTVISQQMERIIDLQVGANEILKQMRLDHYNFMAEVIPKFVEAIGANGNQMELLGALICATLDDLPEDLTEGKVKWGRVAYHDRVGA